MAFAEPVLFMSRALNRIMFGARIANDRDVNSQLGTILSAYGANLLLAFVPVAALFLLSGRYDPIHAPFNEFALRTMLAIANPITLVLMLVASLSWVMHDEAIDRALAVRKRTGLFSRCMLALFMPSVVLNAIVCVIFFVAAFRFFDFGALIAGIVSNCFLLFALFVGRNVKRAQDGDLI